MKKLAILVSVVIVAAAAFLILPDDNYTNNGDKKYGSYEISGGDFSYLDETDFTEGRTENIEKLKDYVKTSLPDEYLNMLSELIIISDGEGGNYAYVSKIGMVSSSWIMCIDYEDAYDENGLFEDDFDETIAHETMHLITLNSSQMDNDSNDDTYETVEGKLKKDSYLNLFYEKFWKDNMDIHKAYMAKGEETGRLNYFEDYYGSFVNDYATINPEEDIAESFSYFVTHDKPTGNDIYEQKVLFFYNYPELVQIRASMRSASKNGA